MVETGKMMGHKGNRTLRHTSFLLVLLESKPILWIPNRLSVRNYLEVVDAIVPPSMAFMNCSLPKTCHPSQKVVINYDFKFALALFDIRIPIKTALHR
jgi:hypothetical protein